MASKTGGWKKVINIWEQVQDQWQNRAWTKQERRDQQCMMCPKLAKCWVTWTRMNESRWSAWVLCDACFARVQLTKINQKKDQPTSPAKKPDDTPQSVFLIDFKSAKYDDSILEEKGLDLHEPVIVKTPVNSLHGILKWSGIVDDKRKCVGVELNEPVKQGTSGTFKGKQLFSCSDLTGIIVSIEHVVQDTRYNSDKKDLKSIAVTKFKRLKQDDSCLEDEGLAITDRVIIKIGTQFWRGELKWCGLLDFLVCAGIELDTAVKFGSNGVLNDIQLFKASPGKGVCVPLSYVENDICYGKETNVDTIFPDCRICMNGKCCIAFVQCGHICVCQKCSKELQSCPICKAKIEKAIQIFVP